MRSMLQLLGGVAVAGAVAAGATAFTATGLTSTIAASPVAGGKVSQSIQGAELTAASITMDTTAGAEDHVVGAVVTVKTEAGANITTGTVKVKFTGANGGTADGLLYACTYSGGGAIWNCPVPSAPTNFYTAVTALGVTVAA
jgi:hypothetical protein